MRFEDHFYPVSGAHRDAVQEFDGLAWNQSHPETLGDGCENEACLGHGKRGTYANARTAAEGLWDKVTHLTEE